MERATKATAALEWGRKHLLWFHKKYHETVGHLQQMELKMLFYKAQFHAEEMALNQRDEELEIVKSKLAMTVAHLHASEARLAPGAFPCWSYAFLTYLMG
ncbi:hypothetical protein FOA52_010113 [Chlamydomonas sp. UWO 241]|nr:hypothetical protein FOA52_010113 [Chlamydomonas sp. UWO 241]